MSGGSNRKVDQISHGVVNISLDSAAQDGEWEVYTRKSKNKARGSSEKSWGTQNSSSKAWELPDVAQKLGMRSITGSGKAPGNNRPTFNADSERPTGKGNSRLQSSNIGFENNYFTSQPAIPPPLEHGWNWAVTHPSDYGTGKKETCLDPHSDDDDGKIANDDDSDAVDSDD